MSKQKQERFLAMYQPVHDRFEKFCRARAIYIMPYKDLINESLLIAYQKIDALQKETSFLSFLIGISLRILANAKKKQRPEYINEEILNKQLVQDDPISQQFEIDMLYRALAKLPDPQREALILFELTGFSIKEIMTIQGSGASAVKQRLARGRKTLAQILKKEICADNHRLKTRGIL